MVMRIVLGLSVSICVLTAPLFGVQNANALMCVCAGHDTPPTQSDGKFTSPNSAFAFLSDADQPQAGASYCYFHAIRNTHSQNALRFNWPAAQLRNSSLPPGEPLISQTNDPDPPQTISNAPLYYGWGNDSVNATVHAAPSSSPARAQATNYPPLISGIQTAFLDEDTGLRHKISLTFRSEVEYVSETRSYTYSFSYTNQSSTQVRVHWKSIDESDIGRLAKARRDLNYQRHAPPNFVNRAVTLKGAPPPRLNRLSVLIFIVRKDGGALDAITAPATAYVPESRVGATF